MLQQKTIYITAKSKYRYANIICSSTHPCLLACNSANFCLLHSRLLPPPRRASRALTTAKTNRADNQSFILTVRLQLMRRRDHCDYLYPLDEILTRSRGCCFEEIVYILMPSVNCQMFSSVSPPSRVFNFAPSNLLAIVYL